MYVIRILAASLLSLSIATAQAEQPQPKLELKLSLSKREIVQFEPFVLKVSLTNNSGKPQKVPVGFDPEFDCMKLFLIEGPKTFSLTPDTASLAKPGSFVLAADAPNNKISHRLVISDNPGSWIDRPGRYKLFATYDAHVRDVDEASTSNLVELTVKAAQGVDKQALKRFRGFPQARFLAKRTTARAIWEDFWIISVNYPESTYAPWCAYYSGWSFQQDFDYAINKMTANNANARSWYERLLKSHPKFPLRVEVEYELARELIRCGKRKEAFERIEKLSKEHSDLLLFHNVKFAIETEKELGRQVYAREWPTH